HARPAGIFAKAAEQQPATVTIEKPGGNAVQASSMLMLMTLGAAQGDEVTLRAEGKGAEASVNALADLLEKDLDAEECPVQGSRRERACGSVMTVPGREFLYKVALAGSGLKASIAWKMSELKCHRLSCVMTLAPMS